MLPLSPKRAALDRAIESLDEPAAIVRAALRFASSGSAALDPSTQRAAGALAMLADEGGDPRAALRALGARSRARPRTRLSLVSAVAEALDHEPASPIGQLAVLSAIEALVAAPDPLTPAHREQLLRDLVVRLFERWLLTQIGVWLDEPKRLAVAALVRARAAELRVPTVEHLEPALVALERSLGGER